MLGTSFSPWPSYTEEEADAIRQVLLSNKVNYWTGNECKNFEAEFAEYTGCKYAISLANGTVALETALRGLGIGCGDEVIVTPRTFLASVSCIVLAGATPVFADVDRDSQNITVDTISDLVTPKTKAIMLVHHAGWPCELDPILALAESSNLFVIEDCAQAHGAKYRGRSVGSFGSVGCWSFCQDKIVTTAGEGGMVTTNDRDLWKRMWAYKDHGKSWDAVYERDHPPGFRWLHESFGINGRLLEIQAAIGRIQLKRLPDWSKTRRKNSDMIESVCRDIESLRVPEIPDHITHARYKLYTFVCPEKLRIGWNRDRIVDEIFREGVPCYQGGCSEVYLEKAFDGTAFRPERRLKAAKELGETSMMFLVHPTLGVEEMNKTRSSIMRVMAKASA